MAKKKSINVTVLVDEAHKHKLTHVTKELKEKGFVLKESLGEIGVLTGSVPPASLATLSTVTGVTSVEEERSDYHTQSQS
jgi:hypothetical protein